MGLPTERGGTDAPGRPDGQHTPPTAPATAQAADGAAPAAASGVAKAAAYCSLLMDLALGVFHLAMPLTAVHLGADPLILGLLGGVQRVGLMSVPLIAGTASDRLGRKRLVIAAALALALVFLLTAGTKTLSLFFLWVSLGGFAIGLFWAPLQAWVGDASASGQLARSVSRFNVAWSTGALVGTLLAGALFSIHPAVPFLFAALAMLGILSIVVRLPAPPVKPKAAAEEEAESTPGTPEPALHPRHGFFLTASRLAIFTAFFVVNGANNLFPKLAAGEGFSPFTTGFLLMFMSVARTGTFFALGRWGRWQYRELELVAGSFLAALGSLGLGAASSSLAFLLAFTLIGTGQGIGYMSSMFYALNTPGQRGRKSGLHEFAVNAGAMVGALAAGAIGEYLGIRAPFYAAALLPLAAGIWTLRQRPR